MDACEHHLKDHNESEHEYKKLLYATYITIWIEDKKKAKAATSISYDAKLLQPCFVQERKESSLRSS